MIQVVSIPHIAKISCLYIVPLMLAKVHMGMNYTSDVIITAGVVASYLPQGILFNYLSLLGREIYYIEELISAPQPTMTQPEVSFMKLYICGMAFFISALVSANYPLYLSYRYPAILGRIVGPYLVYLYESIKKAPTVYDGYTASLAIVSSLIHLAVTVYVLSNKPMSRNPFKLLLYYGITFTVEVTLSCIVLVAFR